MNILIATQAFLLSAMQRDTRLTLATCAAWLDPALFTSTDLGDPYGDEDDALGFALHVCRNTFPDVYADAVQRLWNGDSPQALNREICAGLNRYLVAPLQDIEQIRYGVPFEALGVDVSDPKFADQYPRLARIAAWFDGRAQEPHEIAAALIKSLAPYGETGIQTDLAHFIGWLFGMTGNTLVDYTDDQIWESGIESPSWTPDDIQFINDVQEEANQIVNSALRALDLLETDNAWTHTLRRNIQIASERKHPNDRPSHAGDGIRWVTNPGNSAPDAAYPDPELLPVRRDLAPPDR